MLFPRFRKIVEHRLERALPLQIRLLLNKDITPTQQDLPSEQFYDEYARSVESVQFSHRPKDGSNSAGHDRLDRTAEGWLNLLDPTAGRACLVAVRTYPTGLEKVVGFIVLNINQQPVAEIQDICVSRSALQDDIDLQLMTAALERIRSAAHVTWVTVIHHSSDEVAHRRYEHGQEVGAVFPAGR